jgi:hypothetical protein
MAGGRSSLVNKIDNGPEPPLAVELTNKSGD